MLYSPSNLSVKLWFDDVCDILEFCLPLGIAAFLFVLDFVHSPISCYMRNTTATQAAFVDQHCYTQLSSGLWLNTPLSDASYEIVAQGSVHHAYVSYFLLIFAFLVKAPDIFYTRLCLPEFESIIAQFTIELRRIATFLEDEQDVAASTRTLRHTDGVLLLESLAGLQRSNRFFYAYALKHSLVGGMEAIVLCLVASLLATYRGVLFTSEFDCRLRRSSSVGALASSERASCTLTHATVLNFMCVLLFAVTGMCLAARAVHLHVKFAARRFRNAAELRFLRTPLGSLIRALAYSRYSHAVHQVRAIHANLATGFARCDLHFIALLLAAPTNRAVLQRVPVAPHTAVRVALRGNEAPRPGLACVTSGIEKQSLVDAMQTVQNYVDRFMLLHDHRVGVRFGRNAFGFLKTEEISDRLDFSQVSIRFEFQDFYA